MRYHWRARRRDAEDRPPHLRSCNRSDTRQDPGRGRHAEPVIRLSTIRRWPPQAYLDGELCGVRPNGISSFGMIQAASDAGNAAGPVFFLSWDRCLTSMGDGGWG